MSRYQKKHSLTHTYSDHQSSFISFLHLLRSILSIQFTCLTVCIAQSHFKCCLVYFSVCHPPLHTPYFSSPNHCLLFATHANTIATCFAVVPRLCHLILVSLSTRYFELCLTLTPHIHPIILISAHWSAISFSFLTGQVSLPYNILLHTQQYCCTVSLSLSMIYPCW